MATNLATQLAVSLNTQLSNVLDLGTVQLPQSLAQQYNWANGVAINTADRVFADTRTLTRPFFVQQEVGDWLMSPASCSSSTARGATVCDWPVAEPAAEYPRDSEIFPMDTDWYCDPAPASSPVSSHHSTCAHVASFSACATSGSVGAPPLSTS
jgi:hypothetical protein